MRRNTFFKIEDLKKRDEINQIDYLNISNICPTLQPLQQLLQKAFQGF